MARHQGWKTSCGLAAVWQGCSQHHSFRDTFERAVMKCKGEMPQFVESACIMSGMDSVHQLQRAHPRGTADLVDSVRTEAAPCQRMSAERFVIWRTKIMGVWAKKFDNRILLAARRHLISKYQADVVGEKQGH